MTCKKCGCGPIIGPKYEQDEYGYERLWHRCATCGYRWGEPCKDAAGPAYHGALIAELKGS